VSVLNISVEEEQPVAKCYSLRHGGKVNLSLCFNCAPRHEGKLGKWRYSFTHSWPRHNIEASCQLHAPATLSPRI